MLVLKNFTIAGYAYCYVYVAFLIWLPVNMDKALQMLLALALGLSVDLFYSTIGLHASAAVLMAFLREPVLQLVKPTMGYEQGVGPSMKEFGLVWFARYVAVAILPHHVLLFSLSAGNQVFIAAAMLKALATIICTTFFILSIEQFEVIYEASRRRRR